MAGYYTASAASSSGIVIDRCVCEGGEVGALIGAGVSSNSDGIVFVNSQIKDCKWGISTCHAQTKNVDVVNTAVHRCWTAFTNGQHGSQNGFIAHVVLFGQASVIGNIYGGLHPGTIVRFSGGHTEVVGSIGDFSGVNGTHTQVVIRDASFKMFGTRDSIICGRQVLLESVVASGQDQPFKVVVTADDDLPPTWDSGYLGQVAGSEVVLRNCQFSRSSATSAVADVLAVTTDQGTPTADRKNWCRLENTKIGTDPGGFPYITMANGRAGTIGL